MSKIPFENVKFDDKARYTEDHEYVRRDGDEVVMGITDYAQKTARSKTDIMHLNKVKLTNLLGEQVSAGECVGVAASDKVNAEIYMPISGTIVAINGVKKGGDYFMPEGTTEEDGLPYFPDVEDDPYGSGWLLRIRPDNLDDLNKLLPADEYKARCKEEW